MIGVSNITNRMDPNSLKSRVFVGNLNTLHIQKPELETIFSKYGNIIGISVHKGYAFVQYANEIHARTAACGEDGNIYYGMKLDVTIASEPKNRKRGRSTAGPTICNQQQLVDLALQSQAFAAIGGQFSQLGFMNNQNSNPSGNSALNLTSLFGNPLLNNAPKMPSLSSSSSRTQHHRMHRQLPSSSSSAKRTRLENSPAGGPASSTNVGGVRPANLVSLVTPKSDSISPKSSTTAAASSTKKYPRSNASVISDKLSCMKVDNGFDLQSVTSSEGDDHRSSIGAHEDILICGHCRRLFDSVDALVSHKSNGCNLDAAGTSQCRCKLAGEPDRLDCAYCGDSFLSAWELVSHCHTDHELTIYVLPSTTSPGDASSSPPPSSKADRGDSLSPAAAAPPALPPSATPTPTKQGPCEEVEEEPEDPPTPQQPEIGEEEDEDEDAEESTQGAAAAAASLQEETEDRVPPRHRRGHDHGHHEAPLSDEDYEEEVGHGDDEDSNCQFPDSHSP